MEEFLASLEEKRPCKKLINKEYSQLLVGKRKTFHLLEGNDFIEESKSQKFHLKKNGIFKEVRYIFFFKGTWKVCICSEDNLRSNRSLISKKL